MPQLRTTKFAKDKKWEERFLQASWRRGSSRHLPYQIGVNLTDPCPFPSSCLLLHSCKTTKGTKSCDPGILRFLSFNCCPLTAVSSQDIPVRNCSSTKSIYINMNTWHQIPTWMCLVSGCSLNARFHLRSQILGQIPRKQFKRVGVSKYWQNICGNSHTHNTEG